MDDGPQKLSDGDSKMRAVVAKVTGRAQYDGAVNENVRTDRILI